MIYTGNTGYLEIVLGPMFSGKTSRLLKDYRLYKTCNISCLVINYDEDNRYHDNMLSTHDKVMIPCKKIHNILEIMNNMCLSTYKVFLINEAQFFGDLQKYVIQLVEKYHKIVYVYGLDSDFKRKKFGQILDLIPLADKITKLSALCLPCKNGTRAIFTLRITKEKTQKVIGSDNYIAVCRNCYQCINNIGDKTVTKEN